MQQQDRAIPDHVLRELFARTRLRGDKLAGRLEMARDPAYWDTVARLLLLPSSRSLFARRSAQS